MQKILFLLLLLLSTFAFSHTQQVRLDIGYRTLPNEDANVQAIAVNDRVPAPTLRFKEGDIAAIKVCNHLHEETAIHWHGLILPWQMDGVLGITQNGIKPGDCFQYRFKLMQSGTYWYHAHADLQEQQGLYGAFVIEPKRSAHYSYAKDIPIVLSDWSNAHPEQVLKNLKKSGEYYAPRFPVQASLAQFLKDYWQANATEKKAIMMDYKMMQSMRMGIYDLSDIAYDAYWLNGHNKNHPWTARVRVGDLVRLRFIGAMGTTLYQVKIPEHVMQVIHVQGNDVKPYRVNNFTIGPGETMDVLVKINNHKPVLIYAESIDSLGSALGVLQPGHDPLTAIPPVKPFPAPAPATREKMRNQMLRGIDMDHHMGHHMMMPVQHQKSERNPGFKFRRLRSYSKTNNPHKQIYKVLRLDLTGYMDRYIWFINGIPGYLAKPIPLKENKRYRVIFTNNTMMHHPMHIHGHWFIVRNGYGATDPLLHTIDVPPGGEVIADLDTDVSGQWFFHCHMLYHMMTGMSRIFQYTSLVEVLEHKRDKQNISRYTAYPNRPIVRVDALKPLSPQMVRHPSGHGAPIYFSNLLTVAHNPRHNQQSISDRALIGGDYQKLELMLEDSEIVDSKIENADLDIFYWRLLSQFWTYKFGVNYYYHESSKPYLQPGIALEGLMPYFIATNLRAYYHSGSIKLDAMFDRETQLTNNLFLETKIRGIFASKTLAGEHIGAGLNRAEFTIGPMFRLAPGLSISAEYEIEKYYSALKRLRMRDGERGQESRLYFGIQWLF